MVYQGSKERIAKYILPYIQPCIDDNSLVLMTTTLFVISSRL